MNVSSFKPRLLGSSMLIAAAIAFGATVPALAADVTATIEAGALSSSISNFDFGEGITYMNVANPVSGVLALAADDSRGGAEATSPGWHVNVQLDPIAGFAPDATAISNGNALIPASALALRAGGTGTPLRVAGQSVSSTGGQGPEVALTAGTLELAKKVLSAGEGFGSGTYTQNFGVVLTVPAQTKVGTYTGTLVVTNITAP
jgi:hypothetical protein